MPKAITVSLDPAVVEFAKRAFEEEDAQHAVFLAVITGIVLGKPLRGGRAIPDVTDLSPNLNPDSPAGGIGEAEDWLRNTRRLDRR